MMSRRLTPHFSRLLNGSLNRGILSQIPQIHGVGVLKEGHHLHSQVSETDSCKTHQTLGSKLSFKRFINSSSQKEFEPGRNDFSGTENERNSRSMNYVREIMQRNGKGMMGFSPQGQYSIENNADVVHIKLMKNNTFVTVTDSKGNKKTGASSGCLSEMKGGPKLSRYAAEATAEHIGRVAKNMGIKSVVMKVNGFTFFKKKKQAILSFRDGYTNSRNDQNPIVYIEDTTRKPHNGCRLRKRRRV